jgi:Ca2+-binding RTX toxin-like protein
MSESSSGSGDHTLFKRHSTRPARRPRRQKTSLAHFTGFEMLDVRVMPAVTAMFSPAVDVLTILGDANDNTITVGRDAAGSIIVDGGAVSVLGGRATVANTKLIQVFGLDGNDNLSMDETNGALPQANMFGGAGNDTITGGSGNDMLFGEAGNDTLLGKGGNDMLFGGDGNDTLTGGAGNDQVFGEAGNDTMIWNPGDGTDLNEGGAGVDAVQVNGGNGAEVFTAAANGTRVRFDRTSPAPFSLDIGTTENLVVNMNGGDDTFTAGNGLAPLISLTVDGGAGNDTITGGDGNDVLLGGDGNDTIIGGRGSDTLIGGAGDDTFVWNPGDGSDSVDGQAGNDTLVFNGANVNEQFNVSANGSRVRLTRDVGNITMDLNGIEGINLNALGGADTITVNDTTGTDLQRVNLDLAATPGSGTGDGQADTVVLNGTNTGDAVGVTGAGTSFAVTGLPADVAVSGSEGANDSLVINTLGGSDSINAAGLPAGVVKLTANGGDGNDTIFGSGGADMLIGGDGNDFIDGGSGIDVALMGTGDDTFAWNPGDGSDTVEGQSGNDTLRFNGSNVNENISLSANGTRALLTRDVGNVAMDLNSVEVVNVTPAGGSDTVTVNDTIGSGLKQINLNLVGIPVSGTANIRHDSVILNGTAGADRISVTGSQSGIDVTGLAAAVHITGSQGPGDGLTVNALAGNDTIDASALQANAIALSLNGGDDNDMLIGSPGNDVINGGRGNDVALMGAGDDTFVWNPGDGSDTVYGQAGNDTLVFNGANVNEQFNVSANGSRVRLTRDVGNVTMDLNGIEGLDVNALGGADTITVNDLTGTGLTALNLDLGSPSGSGTGDGQADSVIVNGTNGDDAVVVLGNASGVSVTGLATQVNIKGAESSTDRLTINALAGDDVVEASGLTADAILLTENGGDGNDILIGGDGNDILLGGNGDDVLIGGPGSDVLDGGSGNNILIQ